MIAGFDLALPGSVKAIYDTDDPLLPPTAAVYIDRRLSLPSQMFKAWDETKELLGETHRGMFLFSSITDPGYGGAPRKWTYVIQCRECRQKMVWETGVDAHLVKDVDEQYRMVSEGLLPLLREFIDLDCYGPFRRALVQEFIVERLVATGGRYDYDKMVCEGADVLGLSIERIHAEIALMGFLAVQLPEEHPALARIVKHG